MEWAIAKVTKQRVVTHTSKLVIMKRVKIKKKLRLSMEAIYWCSHSIPVTLEEYIPQECFKIVEEDDDGNKILFCYNMILVEIDFWGRSI